MMPLLFLLLLLLIQSSPLVLALGSFSSGVQVGSPSLQQQQQLNDPQQQMLQGVQMDQLVLPGMQRAPFSFQGFLGANSNGNNNNNRGAGSGVMTNGLDLETFTKNAAIRANQENAIVAQLSNMAPVRRNQLARDMSSGNVSATNELVTRILREMAVSPSGSAVFPSASSNNLMGSLNRNSMGSFLPQAMADNGMMGNGLNIGVASPQSQQQQILLALALARQQQQQQQQGRISPFSSFNQQQPFGFGSGLGSGSSSMTPHQIQQLQQLQQLQQGRISPLSSLNQQQPFGFASGSSSLTSQQLQQLQQLQQQFPGLSTSSSRQLGGQHNPLALSNLPAQLQVEDPQLLRNQLLLLNSDGEDTFRPGVFPQQMMDSSPTPIARPTTAATNNGPFSSSSMGSNKFNLRDLDEFVNANSNNNNGGFFRSPDPTKPQQQQQPSAFMDSMTGMGGGGGGDDSMGQRLPLMKDSALAAAIAKHLSTSPAPPTIATSTGKDVEGDEVVMDKIDDIGVLKNRMRRFVNDN